jgi:hypothetical protein
METNKSNKITQKNVSDSEIRRIIKEEKNLPIEFSHPIKLSLLVKYYARYWNNDLTDEEESDSDDYDIKYFNKNY